MKECFKCLRMLPADSFYRHPMMGDGRLGKCKDCTKLDVAENYRKNIDYYAKYERVRFKNPARKLNVLRYRQKARQLNPEKYSARNAVHNAVRDGRLIKRPCQVCGNPKSQAHHTDYSRQLDVQWLCFTHHREAHGQIVTARNFNLGHSPRK